MKNLPINQAVLGDSVEEMAKYPDNSIHAIVTDPPYGLEFMGKEWDKLNNHWGSKKLELNKDWYDPRDGSFQKHNPVSYKNYLPKYAGGMEAQQWHYKWATEAYRVLMPGASMLVMGGTRTFHRLMCALEDAGFIIKDTLMWLYGSGFPKAQDITALIDSKVLGISLKEVKDRRKIIGKREVNYPDSPSFGKINPSLAAKTTTREKASMLPENRVEGELSHFKNITEPLTPEAKEWEGFKVGGLKPAYEPIIWAVKPPEGSFTDNVMRYGVGAINVDACRVEFSKEKEPRNRWQENSIINKKILSKSGHILNFNYLNACNDRIENIKNQGRYPANVILGCICDEVKLGKPASVPWGKSSDKSRGETSMFGIGGAVDSEFYRNEKCLIHTNPDCPCAQLDGQSGSSCGAFAPVRSEHSGHWGIYGGKKKDGDDGLTFRGDSGGASRFFKSIHTNPDCPAAMLDRQAKITSPDMHSAGIKNPSKWIIKSDNYLCGLSGTSFDYGKESHTGPSRFFYCAKAHGKCDIEKLKIGGERHGGCEDLYWLDGKRTDKKLWMKLRQENIDNKDNKKFKRHNIQWGNIHPTCKPMKLIEWLIKLVTREGQTVLDPFLGSGTTAIACINLGRQWIGIDKEKEYIEIAKKRIEFALEKQGLLAKVSN